MSIVNAALFEPMKACFELSLVQIEAESFIKSEVQL